MYRNNADYVWKRRVSAYENVKRAMKVIGRVSDDLPLARNVTVVHLVFSKHQIMDLEKEVWVRVLACWFGGGMQGYARLYRLRKPASRTSWPWPRR